MPITYHPSLKKILAGPKKWLARENNKSELNNLEQTTIELLNAPGTLSNKVGIKVEDLGHYYGMAACDAFVCVDIANFAKYFRWSVLFNALGFRLSGMYSELHQDSSNWPQQYWDSLKAAGPIILSSWRKAEICAARFIEMAEKDQKINIDADSRHIKHGTNDVFLVYLFSQAFQLNTYFTPAKPLVSGYQNLLDCWGTNDENTFKYAMQAAADFHISRSKDSTGSKFYEFTWTFDRVFPAELLAVQALRRRDGLPAFETGHILIDTPWSMIKDMHEVEPHPLLVAVEARLKKDYPTFR